MSDFLDYELNELIYLMFYFFCIGFFVYNNFYCDCEDNNKNIQNEDTDKDVDEDVDEDSNIDTDHNIKKESEKKPIIPYEEKYMTEVRKMFNEYEFSEEELKKEICKLLELIENEKQKINDETNEINNEIKNLNYKLDNLDNDDVNENRDDMLRKKIEETIKYELTNQHAKLKEIQNKEINEEEIKIQAREFIIDEQLKKYKKSFIIEKTPLGNVLMFYNQDKLTFDYYSDVTIPYRFLETVARKYVLTYRYRPLYIDMEEELKNYEKKMDQIEEMKREELQENIKNSLDDNGIEKENDKKIEKKNVFAKFKTYNKEAGTGKVNTAPPPKNSIPQNRISVNLNDSKKDKDGKSEKILLKERSNRYSHQGKFANFNILQKIDRKKIDKKFALSFADFKKLNVNNIK